jgi:hypothetical protein
MGDGFRQLRPPVMGCAVCRRDHGCHSSPVLIDSCKFDIALSPFEMAGEKHDGRIGPSLAMNG